MAGDPTHIQIEEFDAANCDNRLRACDSTNRNAAYINNPPSMP